MNPLVPSFLDLASIAAGELMSAVVVAVPVLLLVVWLRRRNALATEHTGSDS